MGKALLLLIVLVAAVAGGGYYNYNRNAGMEADLAKPRPYAGVSSADLAKLIAAYQGDIKRAKQATAAAPAGEDAIDRRDSSDLGGKADAFAGFQRENERWKAQRGRVMEQQVELEKLLF
ncbi:MAG: hypothetical protein ACHQ6T_16585, partial [Myxococcota bacterium]